MDHYVSKGPSKHDYSVNFSKLSTFPSISEPLQEFPRIKVFKTVTKRYILGNFKVSALSRTGRLHMFYRVNVYKKNYMKTTCDL